MIKRLAILINRFIRPYWLLLLAVLVLQVAVTLVGLLLPTLNARIIDRGVITGNVTYIWQTGGYMLGLAFIQAIGQITAVYCGARAAMLMGRDIRNALFEHVLNFSTRELNQFGAPSLITRNTNDVQQVQMLVLMTCIMLVSAPITMAGGVVFALREDVGLSWVIAACVVLLGIGIGLIVMQLGPLFETMQQRIDGMNRVLREQISGIRVVRAFVREQHEARRFERSNAELVDTATRVGRLMAALFPIVGLTMNVGTVAVMWFGGLRIDGGLMQIGQLTAFIAYLIQILMATMMTTILLVMAPRAAVCADRIMEVLNTPSSVVAPTIPQPAREHATVEFRDVSFAYPGAEEPVLRHICLTLRPGTTTAIIGSTGAGKSTLINLIPRLFDATDGQVLVGGVDVTKLAPEELWQKVGLVPQVPYLFSGTIGSNVRYGNPDAADEQVWQALTVAQATDFVQRRDGGLDSSIAQGGTNVSGGQRQRLAIARALAKDPEVLIFDDSFSALDVATDAKLRIALRPHLRGKAVLVVAQRISTIRDADQILVLERGAIVGRGTHDELLATNPTYQEIVESQRGVEEAA